MIKTIIFDLGKVIVPFDIERLQKLADFCDFEPDEIRGKLFTTNEIKLYETGKISSKDFFAGIKNQLDLKIDFAGFSNLWNSIFELQPIVPIEFIENLSKNYRLLVLSDTNEMHFEFIRHNFPILNHFDEFILSYQVGEMKPSEKVFRIAVEMANCIPGECVFIDDKPLNVDGAIACGLKAICFTDFKQFEYDLNTYL